MTRVQLSWPVAVVGAVSLVLVGAAGVYFWLPRIEVTAPVSAGISDAGPAPGMASGPLPDVALTLSEEAIAKAAIVVSPVVVSSTSGAFRLPGVVEPDAYRQVVVAPLVSGRVTRVNVALGQQVAKSTPLLEVFSPDLADAQTRYLSMRAAFLAAEQEVTRTGRLAQIGAASQQELERIHAEHVRHRTEVESARARLQLLGMTPGQVEALTSSEQVSAAITVVSPIAGVVTAREVNPGSSVDPATPLLTVVDLSTVWIVGELYERDFSRVSVGMPAGVTTTAFPGQRITGKVAYIDPQVRSETRTARIRVEVPNPRQQLRLGMYAEIQLDGPGATSESIVLPRAAIQQVGDRTVVYLADPAQPGRFIEREVHLGQPVGDQVVVLSGVAAGDRVVTEGSFTLRAERARLGLRAR